MDKNRLDSHKLMFHPDRVSDWLKNKNIYPIYIEISPSGACNHRCVFCGVDFMGYKPVSLKTDIFIKRLEEMRSLGVKSIMYAGEGEPFLHRDMVEIARQTKRNDIDVAFTTNAVLFKPQVAEKVMKVSSWIKVSCNAGTPENYAKIHRTKEKDFYKVIENLKEAVRIKKENRLSCTLGLQILMLPEVENEIYEFGILCREIGLDYMVVKPYSQHLKSLTKIYEKISYDRKQDFFDRIQSLSTSSFSSIVRVNTMRKWDEKHKSYKKCYGMPFWCYIDSRGNVWGCSLYLKEDKFQLGNIHENSFKNIWEGEKRKDLIEWTEKNLDPSSCRVNCRMDEINRYLWELKHPSDHVNFI